MVLYVAGKYSDVTKEAKQKNIEEAEEIAKQLLLIGVAPLVPHKISSHWDDDERFVGYEHEDWLTRFCYPLIDKCDGVFMCSNWVESKGARAEFAYAEERRIPVYFEVEELRHV